MMADIDRDISIEQNEYNIDVNNIEYSIEILPQSTYVLELNEQGPQGLTGPQGETGPQGNGIESIEKTSTSGLVDTYTITYEDGNTDTFDITNGAAATISIGTVATGEPGTDATVVNSGTSGEAVFDFTIPQGAKGDTGNTGATGATGNGIASISKTGTSGLVDTYTITYTNGNTATFTVTNGEDGADGQDGSAATITVGTTTTGGAGTSASVVNSGTSSAAVLDFTIPKGDKGETGSTGATGNGIVSITKTGTSGLIDTYTITYTNGNTDTFTVTNGADGTTTWGGITGVLSNQLDLQAALNEKQDLLSAGTMLEIVTGGSLVPLPAGYTQVEYITTDGTAYINTGITVAETDTLDISFNDTSSATTVMFITGRNGSDGQTMYFVSPSSSLIQWKGRPAGVTFAKNLEYNLVLKSGEVTYTNAYGTTTKTFTGGSVADTGACLIGAGWNNNNTTDSRKFIGNISKWQIKDSSNNLRFNGVPCYNSSDIYGLYDTVSDTFFPSIGANDFTGGNEVVAGTVINFTGTINDLTTTAQLNAINSGATTAKINEIDTINGLIPSQATTSNQLADKAFVNSSVQTATANFRGNWTDWATVPTVATSYPADYAGSTTPTVNDYLVVQDASDYTLDTLDGTWRFKYTGDWSVDGKAGWLPEYQVNETPLTAAQLAALNSGVTSSDVTLIGTALQPGDNISGLVNDIKYIINKANGTGSISIVGSATNGTNGVNIGNNSYTAGYAVAIGNSASANGGYSVCIGNSSQSYGTSGVAIGRGAYTDGSCTNAIGIGKDAKAKAAYAIQLGTGDNTTASTFNVGFADDGNGNAVNYQMLDSAGTIPDARISSNFLKNTATGTSALTLLGTATAKTQAINIGTASQANSNYGTTVGAYSYANGSKASAFGNYARATADRAIQIGQGNNSTADTLQIGFNGTSYRLLDGTTGLIPDARISSNFISINSIDDSLRANWTIAVLDKNLNKNSTIYWQDIAYNGTTFVAINANGRISTSTDGITWTSATSVTNLGSNRWESVACDGTKFVAIGETGYISTSSDGTTWSSATQNANLGSHDWRRITYGDGKFVAIGMLGYVSTSTDGTSWTTAVQNGDLGTNYWFGIAYGNNKFVAIGQPGYISTSTNGTDWATATQNSNLIYDGSHYWRAIAYGDNKFVALNDGGYISTSTDGTTWTEVTQNDDLGTLTWNGITHGDNKFVAISNLAYISTSMDGVSVMPAFPYITSTTIATGGTYVRTWSDGMIEQWNYRKTSSSAGTQSITYPVAFSSEPLLITTYTLAASATTSTTTRNYGYSTSATGFDVYLAANGRLAWYARGY